MSKNKIDVTFDGPIVSGELDEARNAFRLINQIRIELLFPFLSIKIPKCIFPAKIDEKIVQDHPIKNDDEKIVQVSDVLQMRSLSSYIE